MTDDAQSNQTFRDLLEAAPDGILVVGGDGRIILANARCTSLFGYDSKALIGELIEILVPEYIRNSHAALRDGYFHSPHTRPMGVGLDLTAARKDGSSVPVEISLSPFQFEGRPCAIAVVRDVTEIRRMDIELKHFNSELKRSNEELEKFAYVASHDLQEPLRMVSGYAQLLQRRYGDKLDTEAHEYIKFAVDGVKRMQTLINDLLSYSRLSSKGRSFSPVSLTDVLTQALANLQAVITETGATVTGYDLPVVYGDRSQLCQVFQNLIGNAIKFHRDATPPVIDVRARTDDTKVHIEVEDNGIGIDKDYADKVFVIFQRLHSRERYPGTGIGLAICKKIVERHGGEIWFESQPGRGSIFQFTLPKGESRP